MISIIIPSLNQGKYLADALRGILDQSFHDLEVIVIDGGSDDDSLEILKSVAASDRRLRWSSGRDGGPAEAINRGLALAKGEIVAWLNADDLYLPDVVGRVMAEFDAHPQMVMIYGHGQNIDESGGILGDYPTLPPLTPVERFHEGCFISQPTVFMRRSALQEVGFLDERLKTAFDLDLWIRFFKKYPGKIGFLDRVLAQTRLHAATITHTQREVVALEAVSILHRHLGPAPAHWILHHIEEMIEAHPGPGGRLPMDQSGVLLEKARPYLSSDATAEIEDRISKDRRLHLALENVSVGVYPDGWAGPDLRVRVRRPQDGFTSLVLSVSTEEDPCPPRMKVNVFSREGILLTKSVRRRGRFQIKLPLRGLRIGVVTEFLIECDQSFSPSDFPRTRNDHRQLCYQVTACEFKKNVNLMGRWWGRIS